MLIAVNQAPDFVLEVLYNLREDDRKEMMQEFGSDWLKIIYDNSKKANVKIIMNQRYHPVGLYAIKELDKQTAQICLLTTEEIKKDDVYFLLAMKKQIQEWKQKYKRLENYVYKHNKQAIKWLRWLGFNLEEYDKNKVYFYMETK